MQFVSHESQRSPWYLGTVYSLSPWKFQVRPYNGHSRLAQTYRSAWTLQGSKILKLPSVRNCFTLAMTNKLVVIINSLKVTKIKKILPYAMKFLVPNYSCLKNPWLRGYRLPDTRSLCPLSTTEFVEPHLRTKFLGTPLLFMKTAVFRHVTLCILVHRYQHFWRNVLSNFWAEQS